jgi:hypothetical protein
MRPSDVEATAASTVAGRRARRMAEGEGSRILRFWNNDIFNNEEGVLTMILSALEASTAASSRDGRTPLPNPSPTRGEGRGGTLG